MNKFAADLSIQMIRRSINFLMISLLVFSIACQEKEEKEGLVITATTGIIKDGLENLLPENVEILSLMGPGIDPHLYKPTSADLAKLKRADIVVYNGLSLEGKMEEILLNLAKKKPTLAVSDFVEDSRLIKSSAFSGLYDPHIWFDVELWKEGMIGLTDSIYSLNGWEKPRQPAYPDSLEFLVDWINKRVQAIPKEKRILVTAHDAFGYFGKAYEIEVVALQGISTLSEAGLKDIENLIDFIINNEIKSVFVESIISPKAIKAVVEGCRLQGYEVQIGGTLFSDALGAENTPQDNYIGMIMYNVNTIVNSIN